MRRVALGVPKRVWVENGHVFLTGHDGSEFWMEPEIAVKLSRMLGTAGGDALIHKVMDPTHFDCDPTGNG